jgi:hypothetical protein
MNRPKTDQLVKLKQTYCVYIFKYGVARFKMHIAYRRNTVHSLPGIWTHVVSLYITKRNTNVIVLVS